MPPKKRTDEEGLGIDDLSLPKSMVARLAKGVLPANSQIQKDAMLALTRSATVFVNYLAASANDRAILNNKKTIGHDDVFASLKELEFQNFLPRCQSELERYQALQCTKRNDYRKRIRDEQKKDKPDGDNTQTEGAGAASGDGDTTVSINGSSPQAKAFNGDRPTKKPKMEGGAEGEDEEMPDEDEVEDEDEEDEEEEEEDDEEEEEQDEKEQERDDDADDAVRPGPEEDGSESEVD